MTIRVLIIDDSALMRALLTDIINRDRDMQVVGCAADPISARGMIKNLNPDVLTLDVEMPKMGGLEFLSRLMRLRPMPVVMVSSFTTSGSETTLQALEIGAIDYVAKPRVESLDMMQEFREEICEKIRMASAALLAQAPKSVRTIEQRLQGVPAQMLADKLIAIGASTGGTEAIRTVLSRIPAESPGIVMVQHMPESFTPSFASRLDNICAIRVVEAQGGENIKPGHAYLAPGHSHMLVKRRGNGWITQLSDAPPVNRHRPSVDVLFHSVAREVGGKAIGVMLTGMGKDGAEGMLAMRQAGAWNIGQDKESCVVYGMPREADRVGAINEVLGLDKVAAGVMARLRQ